MQVFSNCWKNIEQLHQAAERPQSRFETGVGPNAPVPNFVALRLLSQNLSYLASLELLANRPDAAFSHLKVVHRVEEGLARTPILVNAFIRAAIIGLTKHPFYEGWALRQWKPAHYQEFQKYLASAELLQNLHIALQIGERYSFRQLTKDDIAQTFSWGINPEETPVQSLLLNGWIRSMPKGFWQKNLQTHHEALDILVGAYSIPERRIYPDRVATLGNQLDAKVKSSWPFHQLAALGVPNLGKGLATIAKNQALSDLAYIVCGLELYHARHGSYPDNLEQLTPDFCENLPRDLITGEIPRYFRKGDEFLLYSTGWNGTDEAGAMASGADIYHKDDLAWPFVRVP